MRIVVISLMTVLAGCASTQPAQDTARATSALLLRVEAQLRSEREAFNAALVRQREFTHKNQFATHRINGELASIQREWRISSNKDAANLYLNVLDSRYEATPLPMLPDAEELRVETGSLKQVIRKLAAVEKTLVERDELDAYIAFARNAQSEYESLRDESSEEAAEAEANEDAEVTKEAGMEAEKLCNATSDDCATDDGASP